MSERTAKNDRRTYIADANGRNAHRLAVPTAGRWQMNPAWGIRPSGDRCTIEGTIKADVLTGTAGSDSICGGAGADVIAGGGGDDTLFGGAGNDRIMARDKRRDVIDGGPGRDAGTFDRKLDRVCGCRGQEPTERRPGRDARAGRTRRQVASRSKISITSGSFPISSRARDGSSCSDASTDSQR